MTIKRFTGALRDTWWIVGAALLAAPAVWYFFEPWMACFMPPFAIVTIIYFALFRYDDEGRERSEI